MSDLISRQAALKGFAKYSNAWCYINALPTAEKKGRWIPQDHNYKHGNISTCLYFAPVCSECGNAGDVNMNYCPNCGARMEENYGGLV